MSTGVAVVVEDGLVVIVVLLLIDVVGAKLVVDRPNSLRASTKTTVRVVKDIQGLSLTQVFRPSL